MTAYVVAQLPSAVRRELAAPSARSARARKLKKILAQHDAVVLPSSGLAPDVGGELPYTTIEVPDMASADRLASALRSVEGVESAYAKPGEELP